MRLLLGYGAVLRAFGDDEQLSWAKGDVTLTHANGDTTLENKKEVIRVVVRMPDELALDLDHHEIVTIELADDARLPVTFEGGELVCEIDGLHSRYPVMSDDLHPCRLTVPITRRR